MRVRRHWGSILLVLIAGGAGAFLLLRGGEEEGPELTHEAFVERANSICADLAGRNLDLPPPPVPYGALSEEFFQLFADNVSGAGERLAELNPPPPDDPAADELVRALDLIAARSQEAAGSASVDQSSEVVALVQEISEITDRAVAAEQSLGICPERTSFRVSIGTVVRRTGENPLTETGALG